MKYDAFQNKEIKVRLNRDLEGKEKNILTKVKEKGNSFKMLLSFAFALFVCLLFLSPTTVYADSGESDSSSIYGATSLDWTLFVPDRDTIEQNEMMKQYCTALHMGKDERKVFQSTEGYERRTDNNDKMKGCRRSSSAFLTRESRCII